MFDSIKEWFFQRGLKTYLPLIIRKVLLIVSTYLASKGLKEASEAVNGIDPAIVAELIIAALTGVLSVGMSLKDKIGKKQVPLTPKVVKP